VPPPIAVDAMNPAPAASTSAPAKGASLLSVFTADPYPFMYRTVDLSHPVVAILFRLFALPAHVPGCAQH
jgi:hypothetical protein